MRPNLRSDLRAALQARLVTVRPNRLLDEQIGALIGLAIRRRLGGDSRSSTNKPTAEAVLRLLGLQHAVAADLVDQTLGPLRS